MVGIRTLLVGGILSTYYNFIEFPRHHKPAVFLMRTWVPCRRTLYSLLGCTKKGKFLIRYTMSKGALYPGHFPATQGWVFTPLFLSVPHLTLCYTTFVQESIDLFSSRSFQLLVVHTFSVKPTDLQLFTWEHKNYFLFPYTTSDVTMRREYCGFLSEM